MRLPTAGASALERLRDESIALELCPTSNVHTGAVKSLADHPLAKLLRAGYAATINTDNRLMSGVTMSSELAAMARHHALTIDEAERLALNALAAGFGPAEQRAALATDVIRPAWARLTKRAQPLGTRPAERLTMFGWKETRADG